MMPVNFITRWTPAGKPVVSMTIVGRPDLASEVTELDLLVLEERLNRAIMDIRDRKL